MKIRKTTPILALMALLVVSSAIALTYPVAPDVDMRFRGDLKWAISNFSGTNAELLAALEYSCLNPTDRWELAHSFNFRSYTYPSWYTSRENITRISCTARTPFGGRYIYAGISYNNATFETTPSTSDGRLFPYSVHQPFLEDFVPPPPPVPVCGDGIVNGGDQCDDGNVANGDGCDSLCQWEILVPNCPTGWSLDEFACGCIHD